MDTYVLGPHEARILADACRLADLIDALDASITESGGLLLPSGMPHPAVAELRLQRLAHARLLVALRLPDVDDDQAADDAPPRTQRRGLRGVYTGAGKANR